MMCRGEDGNLCPILNLLNFRLVRMKVVGIKVKKR